MSCFGEYVKDMSNGFPDTNVVVHALTSDEHSQECRRFLELLAQGQIEAELDATVLHELTYTVSRYRKELSKSDVVRFLTWIVELDGISCDRRLFKHALEIWGNSNGLGFVDAYLVARAIEVDEPIYSKNTRHLTVIGPAVPNPLPGTDSN